MDLATDPTSHLDGQLASRRRLPRTTDRGARTRRPRRSSRPCRPAPPADVDRAVAAARAALRRLGRRRARRAGRAAWTGCTPRSPPGPTTSPAPSPCELGTPLKIATRVQAGLPLTVLRGYVELAARPPAEETRRQLAGRPRAGRRGRRDHPVELPAAPGRGEGRPRARRRLHGGAQAERADPADRRTCSSTRSTRPGCPPGVVNLVTGTGPVGRRGHRRAPGRRHGLLHRLHGHRPADLAPRRRPDRPGRAGARRQVGQRDPRRRRPGHAP